ncbi:MAG TPA: hypothetical protein VMQ93_08955 [Novosphingobium sp.]|nr:hypothetical protein [Novosphingobium sp.]
MSIFSRSLGSGLAFVLIAVPAPGHAGSLGDVLRRAAAEAARAARSNGAKRQPTAFNRGNVYQRPTTSDGWPTYEVTAEEEQLAAADITFDYSDHETRRLREMLSARQAVARRDQQVCQRKTGDYDGCTADPGGHVSGFFQEIPQRVQAYVQTVPATYAGLTMLRDVETGFWAWASYWKTEKDRQIVMLYETGQPMIERRRLQIEAPMQQRIIADTASNSGLVYELFGNDKVRSSYYNGVVSRGKELAAETAKAPVQSSDEGRILAAALQSLYNAPGFTLARSVDLVEKRPGSVRVGTAGLSYDYSVAIRNAKCRTLKAGTSCDYEMKLGLGMTLMGMAMPAIDLDWMPRKDTFVNRAGAFTSAGLEAVMQKVASSQSSTSSYNPTDTPNAGQAANDYAQLRQNLQDVQDGLYSTGRIIY